MQVRVWVMCRSAVLLWQPRVDKLQHNLAVIFHHREEVSNSTRVQ